MLIIENYSYFYFIIDIVLALIELSFVVFNSDDWNDIFRTETIVIETSATGQFTQPLPNTIQTIFEQDSIYVAYMDMEESWLGTEVVFFIANNTEDMITVQVRDEAVNGFMRSGIMSADVMPGKMAVSTMSFGSWELEENDIDHIETIEFRFHIFSRDDWANSITTDLIRITP